MAEDEFDHETATPASDDTAGADSVEVHHQHHPIHRWREFLKEVGIIVLGVLIALSAEQCAEWLHWRHKIHDLRQSMALELAIDDGPQAYFRLATHKCLNERLDEIQRAAEAGQSRLLVARLARAFPVTDRTWEMDSWKAFLSADGAAHMTSAEAYHWSSDFAVVPQLDHVAQDEREAVAGLRAIRPADGPMNSSELENLTRAIERLRTDNNWLADYSAALLRYMETDDGMPVQLDMTATRQLTSLLVARFRLHSCVETPDLSPAALRAYPGLLLGADSAAR